MSNVMKLEDLVRAAKEERKYFRYTTFDLHEDEWDTLFNTFPDVFKNAILISAGLQCANLQKANLEDANLINANLAGAKMAGLHLGSVNFEGANLASSNLKYTYLAGVNLAGANLEGVNLEDANLGRANLIGVTLAGAYLKRSSLRGADLTGAKGIASMYIPGLSSRGDYIYAVAGHPDYYSSTRVMLGCFFNDADIALQAVIKKHGDGKYATVIRFLVEMLEGASNE